MIDWKVKQGVSSATIIALFIALFLSIFLAVLALSAPEIVSVFGVGTDDLLSTVSQQTEVIKQITGLQPLLDLFLLAGSYVLVCVLLWLQDQMKTYLQNRGHFS